MELDFELQKQELKTQAMPVTVIAFAAGGGLLGYQMYSSNKQFHDNELQKFQALQESHTQSAEFEKVFISHELEQPSLNFTLEYGWYGYPLAFSIMGATTAPPALDAGLSVLLPLLAIAVKFKNFFKFKEKKWFFD